ncbi:hypothetical protein XA68_11132 [Ophiocordyceps unilateralis]|uniref:Uncharacterized protein n=1 Tax=Ophiocordyceps unilateralis TaxID=268505 RepID=A0A2A9PH25_OPHUN|nr:hypothetical protein XA68_11132 [Ophiocordyceps unilateralis]
MAEENVPYFDFDWMHRSLRESTAALDDLCRYLMAINWEIDEKIRSMPNVSLRRATRLMQSSVNFLTDIRERTDFIRTLQPLLEQFRRTHARAERDLRKMWP